MRERTDLWEHGIERIQKVTLPKDRDENVKKRPRWMHIKGTKLPVFRASEANACLRRVVYAMRGDTPRPMNLDGAFRVYDGQAHQESLVYWLGEMGFEVTDQEKEYRKIIQGPTGRFAVIGHIDGIIHAHEGAAAKALIPYIFEAKGLSTFTMKRDELDIVNKDYRYQVQMYMWLSKLHRALLVMKNKNGPDYRTGVFFRLWELGFNPKVAKEVLSRWATAVNCLKVEKLPEREYAQNSLQCQWCLHNKTCWK